MTNTTRRTLIAGGAALPLAAGLAWPGGARAQGTPTIKIGILSDMSGAYRDLNGPNTVAATRLAAQEFANRGFNVEVVVADHQNKPDVGANIARQWFDRDGVDVVTSLASSAVALAISSLAAEKNKVAIANSTATSDLTGRACNPNTIHWVYDTYMLAKSTGSAMVRAGGDSWFFITADYAFGHALERDTASFVQAAGGRVVGSVRTPFPGTTDFSSFLLQAAAARPKVIGLANAGGDTSNCVKQAAEFGVTRRGIKLAALLLFINDVHGIGLQTAQGLICTETFFWNMNDKTRAWTQRVVRRTPNNYPNMIHAGCYSGTLHFLKAVAAMGVPAAKASGAELVNRMKAMPVEDDLFGRTEIRADGRRILPSYLLEVKSPQESSGPWDYYKPVQTTPASEAFRPLSESACPLIRR
jgi:branched-chain amino acid transport system substrate-binding protein